MADDIIRIKQGIKTEDYEYICCILQGDGFKQYYDITDDQFDLEFKERWEWIIEDNNPNTTAILALSHVLNGEPIDLLKVKNLDENAKLASAAPELLEALNGLLDQCDLGEVNEETQPLIDAAKAAINKATGVKR
jgi:GTPase SAR1 family protein